jgi:hypothetical protein
MRCIWRSGYDVLDLRIAAVVAPQKDRRLLKSEKPGRP